MLMVLWDNLSENIFEYHSLTWFMGSLSSNFFNFFAPQKCQTPTPNKPHITIQGVKFWNVFREIISYDHWPWASNRYHKWPCCLCIFWTSWGCRWFQLLHTFYSSVVCTVKQIKWIAARTYPTVAMRGLWKSTRALYACWLRIRNWRWTKREKALWCWEQR